MSDAPRTSAHPRRRQVLVALVFLGAIAIVTGAIVLLMRDRGFDSSFDTTVADPRFARGAGPAVLLDASHHNTLTPDAALRPLCELLRHDGYRLSTTSGPFTAEALRSTGILVIAGALGANDAGDDPAFLPAELDAIEAWIRQGGSLLLVSDHWPLGAAVAPLAAQLGVTMCRGLVEDPSRGDPERGASHIIFTRANGGLADHPILGGARQDHAPGRAGADHPVDRIDSVMTFTGQSLQAPPGAVALLRLSEGAITYPPTEPTVDRTGGDVRVSMEYGKPIPVVGGAQAVALELDRGRVVVIADAGMIRANRDGGGRPVGMNTPGFDNKRLVRNIMSWLARSD